MCNTIVTLFVSTLLIVLSFLLVGLLYVSFLLSLSQTLLFSVRLLVSLLVCQKTSSPPRASLIGLQEFSLLDRMHLIAVCLIRLIVAGDR